MQYLPVGRYRWLEQQCAAQQSVPSEVVCEALFEVLEQAKGAQALALSSLLLATIQQGYIARPLSSQQLAQGDIAAGFLGLGKSRKTANAALQALEQAQNIVRIQPENAAETPSETPIIGLYFGGFSAEIRRKIGLIFGPKLGKNAEIFGLEKEGGWEVIHDGSFNIYINNSVDKPYLASASRSISAASCVGHGYGSRAGNTEPKGGGTMPYIGKRAAPSRAPLNTQRSSTSSSPAHKVLQSVLTRSQGKATATASQAAAVPPGKWSQRQMQVVIDAVRKEAGCTTPIIVTAKEFGVLRKRMQTYEVSDFRGFLHYILAQWSTLAAQTAKTARRASARGEVQQATVDPVPSFHAIAYRFPYLYRVFLNASGGKDSAASAASRSTEETLRRRVEQLEKANLLLREKAATPPPPPAPRPRVVARRPEPPTDEDIPAWK